MYEIIKTFKNFQWEGVELSIVIRTEPYLNASECVEIRRVIAKNNNGLIPINFNKNDTLKNIKEKTIKFLNEMVILTSKERVLGELNKNIL